MKIEYLITTKNNTTFCETKETFLEFLKLDSQIDLKEESLLYSPKDNSSALAISYSIETGEIPSKEERYFHLTLESKIEDSEERFADLGNKIQEIVLRLNPDSTRINTLWNDIGRQNAIRAYPLINEVENLMRKLISKFMLINVGMDWSKQGIHTDIRDKIKRRHGEEELDLDVLSKTDFNHLSEVLFNPYRTLDLNGLEKILLKEPASEKTFETIKKILPKSNWERHFSNIISYDGKKLKSKWDLLNKLRNSVAHNRYISKSDFQKINGLTKEIKEVLNETIDKLDKINLSEEDKINIVILSNFPSLIAQGFLAEKAVVEWYFNSYSDTALDASSPSDPKEKYDQVIHLKNGQKIFIKINYLSHKSILMKFNRTMEKLILVQSSILTSNEEDLEYHIVFVIKDFMDFTISHQEKVLQLLKKFDSQITDPKIKIVIGYLDDKNKFVEENLHRQ